jgi:hypothetical protein
MPATCAICLLPIVARNDVRVFGTEVMHRGCAASGRVTVGARQQTTVAELRAALASAQEGERRLLLLRQQDQARVDRSIHLADQRVDNAGAERDLAVAREVRATIERDAAVRERDTLRVELMKRTPPPTAVHQEPEDTRDATTIRFSLLDMD